MGVEIYYDTNYRLLIFYFLVQDYKSDIIFLQECESDFFEEDLVSSLSNEYTLKFKSKGESKEGESILFGKNRFKYFYFFHAFFLINFNTYKNIKTKKLKDLSNHMTSRSLMKSRIIQSLRNY